MPPIVINIGQDAQLAPAWFKTPTEFECESSSSGFPNTENRANMNRIAAYESPRTPPAAPAFADLKLPFELWLDVFNFLDDGYDIHALARVCKGMQGVAEDATQRHAALVKKYGVVRLDCQEAMHTLFRLIKRTPCISLAVRRLIVTVTTRWVTTDLVKTVKALPNLRSFILHVASDKTENSSQLFAGLVTVHLPHLRVFSTGVVNAPEILNFIHRHTTLEDLSITDHDVGADIFGRESALPALCKLSCGLPTLMQSERSTTLTHLHIQIHVPQTLETVASLFGAQLVSLRLGVLERLPDLNSPRVVWSTQDILTRFPRLAYIQVHMFEVRFVASSPLLSSRTHG